MRALLLAAALFAAAPAVAGVNVRTLFVDKSKVENGAGTVERHEAVTIKAKNRFGKPLKIEAEGWLARIFQHEIDHLDGVLYIDRAEEVFEPTPEEAAQIKD